MPNRNPVISPIISKISAEDKQITVEWSGNPDARIKGFLLFRAGQPEADIRRMDLIKKDQQDEYTILVADPTQGHFEYTDTDIEPGKNYYYGVLAVSENEEGQRHLSKLTFVRSAWVCGLEPPE